MEPAPAEPKKIHPLSWWLILSVGAFFAVLSFWTWQKWDTVWIERSNGFFPPEWQNEDLEDLAWRHPIYRSNDSYQWAHLADAVAEGNQLPLHHRFDEGIPEGRPNRWHSGLALLLLSFGTWTHKWLTIEENPGRIFVTDLMLQVGARDINLNLQRLSGGETIQVAMPYAFAATSALFPEVHPLGTFYWENATGIRASSDFFAGQAVDTPIDYAVVQGGRQGAPFAKLANWVAKEDVSPASIESGLAWRFSSQQSPEGWEERPFYGTFPDTQFSVRIFSR